MTNDKKMLQILLVEDDKVDRMAFERLVKAEKLPYAYQVANSLTAAKSILGQSRFDLIISDYMLGDGTGLEIFPLAAGTPIIVTTGSGNEEVAAQALQNGAADYLIKDPTGNYLKILPLAVSKVLAHRKAALELENYQLRLESLVEERTLALQQSEEQFRSVVETSHDAIILVAAAGEIISANRGAEIIFGYDPNELLGKNLHILMPDRYRGRHETGMKRVQQTGISDYLGKTLNFEGLKKDGSEFPIELNVSHWHTPAGTFFGGIIRDCTERVKAQHELEKANRSLKTLSRCNEILVRALDEQTLLHDICRVIVETGGYTMCWIGYTGDNGEKSVIPVSHFGPDKEYFETAGITWADTEKGQGPTGTAIRTGKMSICLDIANDPRFKPWKELARKSGYSSSAAFPLVVDGSVIGALNIYAAGINAFGVEEVRLLQELTDDLSYGIQALRTQKARAEAQQKMTRSAQEWTHAMDFIEDAIYLIDLNDKVVQANKSFYKMTGLSPQDTIGKDINLIMHPEGETMPCPVCKLRQDRRDGTIILDKNDPHNPTPFPIQVMIKIIRNDENAPLGILMGIRDLSPIHNLRKSENKLRQLVETAPYGIQESDTDGNITFSNLAHHKILGYDPGELIGKPIWYCETTEKKKNEVREYLASLVETQPRPAPHFSTNLTKDGRTIDIQVDYDYKRDDHGRLTGFISVISDITARKRAEEERQAVFENFKTLIDSMDSLVYVADMETYELLLINKYGRQVWGEIEGKICWQTLQEGRDSPCEFCTNSRLLDQEGKPTGEYTWEFQNTVNKRWYECRDQAIRWNDNRLVRMEIATDITDRKEAEASRNKLENQLRQAQKMEAIGTLAGGIAHDFNNILVPILAYTEMVMDTLPEDSIGRKDLKEVLVAANRAKDLVKQILTFSREKEHEFKPLLVSPIIKESVKLLKASLPSTIEVRERLNNHSDIILADPTQLHQIIMNLCTNAFQAMEKTGGTLEVHLNEIDSNSVPATLSLQPGVDFLVLTVSDTGCGMDEATKERILEPYFTTKAKSGGTGLGLATVHGIVRQFGGEMTFTSEPGKGSIFKVYLPLAATFTTNANEPNLPDPRGNERILFVDDEPGIVSSMARILQKLGYQVTTSTSSLDALKLFRADPDAYDLLITDQTMPGLTGDQLAKEIMALKPTMPIILCSGYSSMINKENALQLGIRAFAMKPVVKSELAAIIRQTLEQT